VERVRGKIASRRERENGERETEDACKRASGCKRVSRLTVLFGWMTASLHVMARHGNIYTN
jgi:hypothetical protein